MLNNNIYLKNIIDFMKMWIWMECVLFMCLVLNEKYVCLI